MDSIYQSLLASSAAVRLDKLRAAVGAFNPPVQTDEVNNHVHTNYSFSPHTPTATAYCAIMAGLSTVGSMDHDSVSGANEMSEAGKIIGIATTVGCEIRVDFSKTAMAGRKFNNPDSQDIVYMAIHGIPHHKLDDVKEFLKPICHYRNLRNQKQIEKLNSIIMPLGVEPLDFQKDVAKISSAQEQGSITERHILYAFAKKIVKQAGIGQNLVNLVSNDLGVELSNNIKSLLLDIENPHYLYDLLGVLKGSFLPKFFVQPDNNECVDVQKAVDFANAIGAIPAYAYLGDVEESPTGDKKAEKFEDAFLDELMLLIKEIGFKAVTYMPPRNSLKQLERIQALCKQYNFMEISGVDINSSRQSFNCPIILTPPFKHLTTTTWALIAHEWLASCNDKYALFNQNNPLAKTPLSERINKYAALGKQMDKHNPETIIDLIDF